MRKRETNLEVVELECEVNDLSELFEERLLRLEVLAWWHVS